MTGDRLMTPMTTPATPPTGLHAGRYVTFLVAGETYAVPALCVREVMRWVAPTRVPHGAPAVKGVINLRGEIVTALDLRVMLGLPATEPTDRTCLVVVWVTNGTTRMQVGLIVDTALDVTRITELDSPGDEAARALGEFVTGIARCRTGLTIMLDVDRLVLRSLAPVLQS